MLSDAEAAPSGEPRPAQSGKARERRKRGDNGGAARARRRCRRTRSSSTPTARAAAIPGRPGLGVVILDGGKRRELSEYLGVGTNNIAELMAIVRALEEVPHDRTVVVHADSSYALGLLGKGWKAKANQEIVERMRTLARKASRDLRLVKVDGHAGVPENERADELARSAVVKRG